MAHVAMNGAISDVPPSTHMSVALWSQVALQAVRDEMRQVGGIPLKLTMLATLSCNTSPCVSTIRFSRLYISEPLQDLQYGMQHLLWPKSVIQPTSWDIKGATQTD